METPLNSYTFRNRRIRSWVESRCKGVVLNLFAGRTLLNLDEMRVDKDDTAMADYHMDALDFVKFYRDRFPDPKYKFNTAVLDPPYSLRKSMEFYHGHKASKFAILKKELQYILAPDARMITFGYSTTRTPGYRKVEILDLCHGGAYHDTLALVEDRIKHGSLRDW